MLVAVTAATALPVTVEEAREWCHGPENGDDDTVIEVLLRTAIEFVEEKTGLALSARTFQYQLDGWPCWGRDNYGIITLPRAPVRDVTDVEYIDEDGALQTVATDNWSWSRSDQGAYVWFSESYSFPSVKDRALGTVRITFDAGYDDPETSGSGDDPNLALPFRARAALRMLTSHWYENREAVSKDLMHPVVLSAEALMSQLKVYR